MFVKNPSSASLQEDTTTSNLRPQAWDEYVGQENIKANLRIIIEAAQKRQEPLEHLLFYGNPGLGKTTLAHVIAHEMSASLQTCTGPTLEKAGDLASLLSNLQDGDVLFLDECHRLHKTVMEMLYSAMEDFTLHLVMGKGPLARTMDLHLPRFTLLAATTRIALLPAPLRNRFGGVFQLQFYTQKDVENIVRRSAAILQIPLTKRAIALIASRSRNTPRIANRILKRVRDFATIDGAHTITESTAQKALDSLEIDTLGLEHADRKILDALIRRFSGGPAGIHAIAAAAAEEPDTILDVYEPYLLQLGLLERTARGRVATAAAYTHLQIPYTQQELL